MINYSYNKEFWPDFQTGNSREWCITNGLGSYGGGSLIGSLNRTHQGLLVASLHSPINRFVVLEQISERIRCGGHAYDLETSQKIINGKTIYKNGQEYLTDVVYDGTVTFHYECGKCIARPASSADEATTVQTLATGGIPQDPNGHSITHRYVPSLDEWNPVPAKKADSPLAEEEMPEFELTKYIALKRDENTVAIAYDFVNNTDSEATVFLTPWFNFREHNTLTYPEVPKYYSLRTGNTLSLVPREHPYVRIDLAISGGQYLDRSEKIGPASQLETEVLLETEGLCSHYTPFDIQTSIPAHTRCSYSITCTVIQSDVIQAMALLQQASDCFLNTRSAHKIVRAARQHYIKLVDEAGYNDDFANRLVIASDHFLCKRESTGSTTVLAGLPWFTDWGRDTMISFTGLTLCTKRYDDAGKILFTFAKNMDHGLIPNMFPDDGAEPMYNSVDASLWYFIAVYKYLKYLRADENVDDVYLRNALSYVYNQIFPCLEDIIEAFETGTIFAIRMEPDGLIHAGNSLDQVTWMDVRVGTHVMTPRHGAPVEVNALWYNALCVMTYLCKVFKVDDSHYTALADKVKKSFNKAFWNPSKNCLYDVVNYNSEIGDYDLKDDAIRPNQIFAVSLPFGMLTAKAERAIVDVVERKLFVGIGLRTLSVEHADYHGLYRGALEKRDEAYHQGTAWAYLLGPFFTAYKKVNGSTKSGKEKLLKLYEPVLNHMIYEGCVGGISEVFDGDTPHQCGGCYNQAWSVAEILRSYTEDYLNSK